MQEDLNSKHTKLNAEHPKVRTLAFAFMVIISVGAGFGGGYLASRNGNLLSAPVREQQVVLKTQGELIGQIARNVGESVVSVETTEAVNGFFGRTEEQGAGTGIILTDNGLIVTNRHVVPNGVSEVRVVLSDGTELDNVSVVGRTSSSDSLDIAFLKINDLKGHSLKAAKIGDSSKMKAGDPVIAIGNALGQFQNTVTSGIISGYGRNLQAVGGQGGENLENLFQTDAAINPGNSGGPLVNLDGEVIGINTAIAAGDAQNIGFAIPINDVNGLIETVKQTGKLERPYLGVYYIPLTNDRAEEYGLSVKRGAYIAPPAVVGGSPILKGGPADKAGLRAGDIIIKIGGAAIDDRNSLSSLINRHKVGDKVEITIVREGKEQKLNVTLGAAPAN